MMITFGIMLAFFLLLVVVLQKIRVDDRSFSTYAVGNRSFGARYQAMSFLNTWYPGAMFTAFGGMAVASGVISFYVLSYSLLTVVLMYVMAKPVWTWGKAFDLRTQPDLFALRYNSRHIRTIAALIGIISGIPWLVLGMQALGEMFRYISLGAMSFSQAVIFGVIVIAVRQFWTVRIGMRGVVISDFFQGIMAYIVGTAMLIGLNVWLVIAKDISFAGLDPAKFSIPNIGSKEGPLYLFSLVLTGALGGWCWPYIFVRLFTANGVQSLKKSAALAVPLSLLFCAALLIFGMLASALPAVVEHPTEVWFIISHEAGGLVLLGLAGTVLLAASMGHIDGNIQATGAQIANDLLGNYFKLDTRQLIIISKFGMLSLTILSSWLACMKLPALFSLAVLAYQGIIQLAVPQFLGIFWKQGNRYGAIASMTCGFMIAVTLELMYPTGLPWAYGLTSGAVALVANVSIYTVLAYLLPQSQEEAHRVNELFRLTEDHKPSINAEAFTAPQVKAPLLPLPQTGVIMTDAYHRGSRKLQEAFRSQPMADRLAETIIQSSISPEDMKFIEEQNMFFLATADDEGNLNCSYKGGAKGFVRVLDETTLAFPSYDGNSMFLSMGNILVNSQIGLLFVDFNRQARLRVNGQALIDLADPLLSEYHEADMVVRVNVRQVFPNCPRYVHKMQLVEESVFVPNASCKTPAPPWKNLAIVADVLSEKDMYLAGNDQGRFKAINREDG